MTLETLREKGLALYADHCVDSGVAFEPPSPYPDDYDLFYATPDGAVDADMPLLAAAGAGGSNVRTQLQLGGPKPPVHMVLVPGRLWTQRHALDREEQVRRRAMHDHRDAVVGRWKALAVVSQKRALATFRNRARHMALVDEVEAALFGAFAAMNEAALASQRSLARLEAARAEWERVLLQYEAAADALHAAKRRFFAGSANAVAVAPKVV